MPQDNAKICKAGRGELICKKRGLIRAGGNLKSEQNRREFQFHRTAMYGNCIIRKFQCKIIWIENHSTPTWKYFHKRWKVCLAKFAIFQYWSFHRHYQSCWRLLQYWGEKILTKCTFTLLTRSKNIELVLKLVSKLGYQPTYSTC